MSNKITIRRLIHASVERVFDAYITPGDLRQWSSAGDGWTIPSAEVDARQGGKFKIHFKDPSSTDSFDFVGTYIKIIRPEKISYVLDDGRHVDILFEPAGHNTNLTVSFEAETINSEELQRKGWTAQIEHLETYLSATS
jgi:uncharacterized protein YndB with AHSA1/START domain